MIQIGSLVRVKPPFDSMFPGDREVVGQSETGAWQILNDNGEVIDFSEDYLELA